MRPPTTETKPPFSLVSGGPTCRLLARLARGPAHETRRLAALLVAVSWGPLLAVAVAGRLVTGRIPSLFADFALQARLLLAIPLLLAAEPALAMRTGRCIERLKSGRFVEEGPTAIDALTAAAVRWRDARRAELICALLAVTGSMLTLQGMTAETGLRRGRLLAEAAPFLMIWYGLVGLPLYQFLLYRWLWRWAIWSRLLWSLSRLRLRPLCTHPDRRGGLSLLAAPAVGFGLVVLAVSSVQAGVWADQVVFAGATLASVKPLLALLLAISLLVTFGPLLAFAPALWRARFTALRQYGALGLVLSRLFHTRWIRRGRREGLLGTPDVSTLADFGSVYQVVAQTRLFPFGLGDLLPVTLAVVAPMIPVALLRIPLLELIRTLGSMALGGGRPH
jgi:hypothetical protein